MILIGLGANLPHPDYGPPRDTCEAGLEALRRKDINILRCSSWYESAPVPPSDQPWFVNAVARVATGMTPAELMTALHEVEADFGRVRAAPNAARVLDLDLLDFDGHVSRPGEWPKLPHPRLDMRAFVIIPLLEIAPNWHHPVSGLAAAQLVEALPTSQLARPLAGRA